MRREVLDTAVQQALATVLVRGEDFAVATGKNEGTGRYSGLIMPPDAGAAIQIADSTLLVDTRRAEKQIEEDRVVAVSGRDTRDTGASTVPAGESSAVELAGHVRAGEGSPPDDDDRSEAESVMKTVPARFFGSVTIDPDRYARDIGNVIREVIDRLAGTGAGLEITIDIQAIKPEGFSDTEIRTISENTRVLKFDPGSGFEKN